MGLGEDEDARAQQSSSPCCKNGLDPVQAVAGTDGGSDPQAGWLGWELEASLGRRGCSFSARAQQPQG